MRLVWTVLFALVAGSALAASPEDDYIAARDKAISDISALNDADTAIETVDTANGNALADLQKRLDAIVGPFQVADFPSDGTINLESLNDSDIGFGMLDGLRHGTEDGPSIVATTRGLLERWLQSRSGEADADMKMPADIAAALKLDAFYTEAIGSDAAFAGTLDLPLKTPKGADMAVARLGGWTQDVGPIYDQKIVVTLAKGTSVMIAEVQAAPPVPKIAACESAWADASAAAQKLADEAKDDASYDAVNAAWEKGDGDYRACMGEHLPNDPAYAALIGQAQALADRMAGK